MGHACGGKKKNYFSHWFFYEYNHTSALWYTLAIMGWVDCTCDTK